MFVFHAAISDFFKNSPKKGAGAKTYAPKKLLCPCTDSNYLYKWCLWVHLQKFIIAFWSGKTCDVYWYCAWIIIEWPPTICSIFFVDLRNHHMIKYFKNLIWNHWTIRQQTWLIVTLAADSMGKWINNYSPKL